MHVQANGIITTCKSLQIAPPSTVRVDLLRCSPRWHRPLALQWHYVGDFQAERAPSLGYNKSIKHAEHLGQPSKYYADPKTTKDGKGNVSFLCPIDGLGLVA